MAIVAKQVPKVGFEKIETKTDFAGGWSVDFNLKQNLGCWPTGRPEGENLLSIFTSPSKI